MASPFISLVVVLVISAGTADVDASKCSPGWATCSNYRTCKTNVWSDLNNCGHCRSKCAGGPHATSKCKMGKCSFECDQKNGWSDCDRNHRNGCEVSSQTDKNNCGVCKHVCPAPANFVASCVNGACKKECKYGYKQCNNACVKVASDVTNCGGCGVVCSGGGANGTPSCAGGRCGVQCKAGYSMCKCECLKLSTDPLNCGGCGTKCLGGENGTAVCVGGECGLDCKPGLTKCSGKCVNVDVDVMNCGGCGTKCSAAENSPAVCVGGKCGLECQLGTSKCNDSCSDYYTDVKNCGGCGMECLGGANGTAVCVDGHCDLVCKSGFNKCNGKCVNVDVDVDMDIMNCGSCGTECLGGENGTAVCVGGHCDLHCIPSGAMASAFSLKLGPAWFATTRYTSVIILVVAFTAR